MNVFQRSQGILYDVPDQQAMLIDCQGTELIELNPVGTAVWEALDGRRGSEAIADELAARFPEANAARIAADVETFLEQLHELGLVERAGG